MGIFHEVKNRYFNIIFKVLNECKNGMSKKDIIKIVDEEEFQEKVIGKDQQTFSGLLLNEYNQNFNLLKEECGLYYPVVNMGEKSSLPVRFTNIEKAWLKALMEEPNIRMILNDSTITKIKEVLKDIDTPISCEYIETTNISKLTQIENLQEYEANSKILLKAIMQEKPIRYCNTDRFGNKYSNRISLPIRLEYSLKDGRFRVSMFSLDEKRPIMANICSMSNIVIEDKVKSSLNRKKAVEYLRQHKYSCEPVILEVIDKKAAMERCFMSFSGMERSARCIGEDRYEIKLSYYTFDEEEVIRKILALGPYVKVLSPERIAKEVVMRIRKSIELLEIK